MLCRDGQKEEEIQNVIYVATVGFSPSNSI